MTLANSAVHELRHFKYHVLLVYKKPVTITVDRWRDRYIRSPDVSARCPVGPRYVILVCIGRVCTFGRESEFPNPNFNARDFSSGSLRSDHNNMANKRQLLK